MHGCFYDLRRSLCQIHIGYLCTVLFLKRHAKFGRHSSLHASVCQVLTIPEISSPISSLGNKWQLMTTNSAMVPDLRGHERGKFITKWKQMSIQLSAGLHCCK